MAVYSRSWFVDFDGFNSDDDFKFKKGDRVFVKYRLNDDIGYAEGIIKDVYFDYPAGEISGDYVVSIVKSHWNFPSEVTVKNTISSRNITRFENPIFEIGKVLSLRYGSCVVVDTIPMFGFHLYKVRFSDGSEKCVSAIDIIQDHI